MQEPVIDDLPAPAKFDLLDYGPGLPQRIGHGVLTFASGNLQNLHVHLVGHLLGVVVAKHVVSDAEPAGGKHFLAILIVRKCARLANQ